MEMDWIMKAYFIGSAIILVYLFFDNLWTRGNVDALKDVNLKLRDKWAQTEALCRKLEAVALWFLDRKNMTLENTGSWVTPWLVVAKKDPNDIAKLSDAWAAMYAQREEIAHALLEALRQWDKEREANWAEKTKGKKK